MKRVARILFIATSCLHESDITNHVRSNYIKTACSKLRDTNRRRTTIATKLIPGWTLFWLAISGASAADVTGFVNFFNVAEDYSLVGIGPESGGVTQYYYIRTNTQIAAVVQRAAFASRVSVPSVPNSFGVTVTGRVMVSGSAGGITNITSR